MRSILTFAVVAILSLAYPSHAQSQATEATTAAGGNVLQLLRLDELAKLLDKKTNERNELKKQLSATQNGALPEEQKLLEELDHDIATITSTFELIALGNVDISLLNDSMEPETDWRQDLLQILKPLVDSLKSLTKRPRQIAELRDTVYISEARLKVIQQALQSLESISSTQLRPEAVSALEKLSTRIRDEKEQFEQERLVAQSQLDKLTNDQQTFFQGVWPTTRAFLAGRGLTLLVAVFAAIFTWALMRFFWWVYTTRFTTKAQRRNSSWFRLAAYSYYLLTSLVVIFAILMVLYVREDLLLMALAFVLIAGAVLSFRTMLPRYVKEARLLLNLGSVREDERVIYNGLPFQVVSLNIYSILRNPALDGIIRLPLETLGTLVSRPVKNNLWFPSRRNDYVILPDGSLGQVKYQTPDLVEVTVRGGMSMTFTTPEYYALHLVNLSREETFGVSITFGLDYSLQSISVTEIPRVLETAVVEAMSKAGYEQHLDKLVVELSAANTSSLDFLIFATIASEVAGDYYKIQRLLQQTCVAVSNVQQWVIPFPQLTVHQSLPVERSN